MRTSSSKPFGSRKKEACDEPGKELRFKHIFRNGAQVILCIPVGHITIEGAGRPVSFQWQGRPPGQRELQQWTLNVASTLARRQRTTVGLKLDCPTSFRAWLIRPGKPPERVYRRQEVQCPFVEIRINARNWLPPKIYREKQLAEMRLYAEEPRLAPMPRRIWEPNLVRTKKGTSVQ